VSRPLLVLGVSAALLLPGSATSAGDRATVLTATRIRSASHPAFVRVVVDFTGGAVTFNTTNATDPNPFDGSARVEVERAGVRSVAAPLTALGVTTRVTDVGSRLGIRLTSAAGRFKYLSITILHAPERVVIDLWRSTPNVPARFGRPGCLTITSHTVTPTSVRVSGRETDLFEHSFVVRVRGSLGGVAAQRIMTATGPWSTTLAVGGPRRLGTLEAVAGSAKDGSLDCLVQVPVTLGA
jgi:hypothetical protein